MFRKQKDTTRRVRQPAVQSRSGTRAVFSYHASRSARPTEANAPRTAKRSWAFGGLSEASSGGLKRRVRRLPRLLLLVAAVAALGYNLLLEAQPTVIPLVEGQNRQVFLRQPATYEAAARAALDKSFTSSTKLTIDTSALASDLQAQFPELEHVSVVVPFIGRQPKVYIQPARPALLLKTTANAVFILSENGQALMNASQVSRVEKLGLPLVEDQSGLPVELGDLALPRDNVAFITEVVGQLKAKKLTVANLVLPQRTSELHLRIEGQPYTVKYNLHGDARAEVGTYLAVRNHLAQEHKTPGAYIDVRVENRAYYQ